MGKRYSPAILFNYGNSLELAKFITNNENKKNTTNTNKEDSSAKESTSIPRSLNEGGINEKIAIIGMSLRLPGSINSAKSFWMALAKGKNCVLPPVKSRNLHQGYVNKPSDQLRPWEHNIPYVGCYDTRSSVAKLSQFDAEFFNCLPDEALALDPRHRWVLETSWEALENAGIPPNTLEDTLTGVFVGIGQENEYSDILEDHNIIPPIAAHADTQSGLAGRLSYFYRLYGPAFTMDTACSTGASALHTACRSLQHRDCNLSIVSGVRCFFSSKKFYKTCSARMASPHGRCATFDKDADGFASGEGCVCFILKRLSDAIRDNDHILSVIIGTSCGQSGLRQSISAPSSEGQAINIKRAMEFAGIKPEDVSYVEAHGTGTPLGDALEVHSLNQVYAGSHTKENPLVVGSVKTNIGHTAEVAGLAGIAKVILAMQHKHIPKNLHFNTLNPEIDIESIPIKIPTKTIPWTSPVPNKPLIAQVSSFGLQGSIVHVLLEEYIP
ncbi:thiolase-like protein, partial [Anaeromyces robustus]